MRAVGDHLVFLVLFQIIMSVSPLFILVGGFKQRAKFAALLRVVVMVSWELSWPVIFDFAKLKLLPPCVLVWPLTSASVGRGAGLVFPTPSADQHSVEPAGYQASEHTLIEHLGNRLVLQQHVVVLDEDLTEVKVTSGALPVHPQVVITSCVVGCRVLDLGWFWEEERETGSMLQIFITILYLYKSLSILPAIPKLKGEWWKWSLNQCPGIFTH